METGGASVSGNFPNSTICETSNTPPASPFDRDYNFNGQVVSGTGKFKKVIASSSNVFENGQQFAQMNGSVANGTTSIPPTSTRRSISASLRREEAHVSPPNPA